MDIGWGKSPKKNERLSRKDDMEKIIDATVGQGSSSSFLLIGDHKTALMDCGMAYCADLLISRIQALLTEGRKLDYVLLSHSHYDHIGAVPYLRMVWPDLQVLAAEYAQKILNKPSALKQIKQLGQDTARYYGALPITDYDDDLMKVDRAVAQGSWLDLGGMRVDVLETPGHTKCSLSFLINREVIFASETTGTISESGKLYSSFINSYGEAIASINRCREAKPRFIISPHFGWVHESEIPAYWDKAIQAAQASRDFILALIKAGYDEDEIFIKYKMDFRDEALKNMQPDYAFEINGRAMIRGIIHESLSSFPAL
ncbi:MAG TPA: MBL fold metallo-hydrolase [Syntrophomonas sp.]|nr:MBL fold metallo-hydrolase [Syntrophomonas sp.]